MVGSVNVMLKETLRNLRYARMNSALARHCLGLLYRPGHLYAIPFGSLRGLRLFYDPSIDFHTMLGLWEAERLTLLRKLLPRFRIQTVYDIGANIGFYTLFFAQVLPAEAKIYAFEPAPATAARLRDHLAINHKTNTEVIEAACSNRNGQTEFYLSSRHHSMSSLHAHWAADAHARAAKITVPTVTLDDFIYGAVAHQPPDFIKMDIEGGGTFALPGCARCLQDQRPLALIESHTPDEDRAISQVLLTHEYQAFRLDDQHWVSMRAETHPHPQGVWGTLLLCPTERRGAVVKVIAI